MSTIKKTTKALALLALLIGTTACDEALRQVEDEVKTSVGPALSYDPATGRASDDPSGHLEGDNPRDAYEFQFSGEPAEPVRTEVWTTPEPAPRPAPNVPMLPAPPRCEKVPKRVVLSSEQISETRRKAMAELRGLALDMCGAYRRYELGDVTFEDRSFFERTELECVNIDAEEVEVSVATEIFGTTANALVRCWNDRADHRFEKPAAARRLPLEQQVGGFDVQPTCTIDGGAACCDNFRCCLDQNGGDGYCIERFGATAIFGR